MADHDFHSGESLGEVLGLSRAAIWKQIQALQEEGVEFETQHGKGYRLISDVELLDEQIIVQHLPVQQANAIDLTLLAETESTNSYLLAQAAKRPQRPQVCITEKQIAGRGRRGRQWQSPYGTSLAMSLLWRIDAGAAALAGLSLATGVAVTQSLETFGATDIQLKWPNDLVCGEAKLGGILIEVSGDAAGPCYAVIGLGLNIAAPQQHQAMQSIEQRWCNLKGLVSPTILLSRNRICAQIITGLLTMLPVFERQGFAAYREAFIRRDALYKRQVTVLRGTQSVNGKAIGVANDGSLLVDVAGEQLVISSGEVSVRALI